MAVAVKSTSASTSGGPFDRLPAASLAGVVYVLGSLGVVFGLVPRLTWDALAASGFEAGSFVAWTLVALATVAAAAVLVYLGGRLLRAKPIPGLRAGVFVGLVAVLVVGLLARWASIWLEHWTFYDHLFGASGMTVGIVLTAAVALGLLVVVGRLYFNRDFEKRLVAFEEQGWFSATSYKKNQGVRVRRGTILGILVLIGAGIFTMISSRAWHAGRPDWVVNVPFTGQVTVTDPGDTSVEPGAVKDRFAFRDANEAFVRDTVKITDVGGTVDKPLFDVRGQLVPRPEYEAKRNGVLEAVTALEREAARLRSEDKAAEAVVADEQARAKREELPAAADPRAAEGRTNYLSLTLLPAVRYSLPLLLSALTLWFAWRVVNYPAFADFLIATEAELNKVSWTTRKRLVQDTVVVLITVVLMTFFLLVVDGLWFKLLSSDVLRVLQISQTQSEKVNKEQPW